MMPGTMYSSPDYAMGASEPAQPVTRAEKAKAEAEIKRMRRELKGWLKFRSINNAVSMGKHKARVSSLQARKMIEHGRDWRLEQKIGNGLHVLLSEIFDASQLPSPDLHKDPDAAAKLAKIAIAGKVSGEAPSQEGQGAFWVWPAVAVVGLVLFTVIFKIRSDAATAQEKERIECIKMGACTDYGFWIKMGVLGAGVYVAWQFFGLKEVANRARRKAAG